MRRMVIEPLWVDFVERVLGPSGVRAGSVQAEEMRRAFYAGVSALMQSLQDISGKPNRVGVKLLATVDAELQSYLNDLLQRASAQPPEPEPEKNLAAYDLFELDGYEVAEWTPLPDGKGKPQQVHFVLRCGPAMFTLRMKSSRAVNELIETLATHRDGVWPPEEN